MVATADGAYTLNGQFAVIMHRDGKPNRMFLYGGSQVTAGDEELTQSTAADSAAIVAVEDSAFILDKPIAGLEKGQAVTVQRGPVRSTYFITGIDGARIGVSPTTWIGQGRLSGIADDPPTVIDGREVYPLADPKNRLQEMAGHTYPPGARNYYSGRRRVLCTDT
jgi:hypothetical protein